MPSFVAMARACAAFLAAALLAGCATSGASSSRDPWEGMNRKTHAFNDAIDRAVLKPVAQGYQNVVPQPVRTGVNNFFGNIEDVGTGLNNLLQGKGTAGVSDFWRVVVNTTIGIAGIFDWATPMGLEKHNEDFGQTLGWYGVQPGPYLVLPLLGPSTVRDAPARAVDPSWYYGEYIPWDTSLGVRVLDTVRTRANLLQAGSVVQEAALDQYTFIRDAWLQRRRNMVYDGSPPRQKEED